MSEGNDDQVCTSSSRIQYLVFSTNPCTRPVWAFSMMSAAEYNLPIPPADKPDWLAMAQSVFNQFVTRYEKEVADNLCGGGLRCKSVGEHICLTYTIQSGTYWLRII